jgi:RimJ/RimL family protein N-acetyltransferase
MENPVANRLVLRRPQASDADDALGLMHDPETALWFASPEVVDHATAVEWCERGADWSSGRRRTWHAVTPDTDRLVVNISLFDIDEEHGTANIAYRVVPWLRRQGYGREAVMAVTEFAFHDLGLTRVQLEHSVPNIASCALALSAGFALEGTTRSAHVTSDGVRQDVHIHGRLSTDPNP